MSTVLESLKPSRARAINALLGTPPPGFGFSSEEIGEICRGENLRNHLATILEGSYLDNIMLSVDWWTKVVHPLLEPEKYGDATRSCRDSEEFALAEKLSDINRLHEVAYLARYTADAMGPDPTGLELVRRHREFARYICRLVERDVPWADHQVLWTYS